MTRRSALIRLGCLALLVAGGVVFVITSGINAGEVRREVEKAGPMAPVAFVIASSLLTVLFVPGPLLSAASGLLFGTWLGTPLSIIAATTGACLAFSISRWWAHDAVEHLAGKRVAAIREWVGTRGFRAVFYARLAPGAPYNLVNYASGLAPVKLRDFALATLIGCAPRAFAYTAIGGSISNLDKPEAMIAVAVLVVMGMIGLVPIIRERRRRLPRPSEPGTGS